MHWCTSRLDPGAQAGAAEPWNGESLEIRARGAFPPVSDHRLFPSCLSKVEVGIGYVEAQRTVVVLGAELQQGKCSLGFQFGCDGSLIFVFQLCWLSVITGDEEAKTFSCSSAKSNLVEEITLNLKVWAELSWWDTFFCPQKVIICWLKLASPTRSSLLKTRHRNA